MKYEVLELSKHDNKRGNESVEFVKMKCTNWWKKPVINYFILHGYSDVSSYPEGRPIRSYSENYNNIQAALQVFRMKNNFNLPSIELEPEPEKEVDPNFNGSYRDDAGMI